MDFAKCGGAGTAATAATRTRFARVAPATDLRFANRQPCHANIPPANNANTANERIVDVLDCCRDCGQPVRAAPNGADPLPGCGGSEGAPKGAVTSTRVSIFKPASVSICETIQRASWRLSISSASVTRRPSFVRNRMAYVVLPGLLPCCPPVTGTMASISETGKRFVLPTPSTRVMETISPLPTLIRAVPKTE